MVYRDWCRFHKHRLSRCYHSSGDEVIVDFDKTEGQIDKAGQLQDLLLDSFIALLSGEVECTATDRATILRFLQHNGWTVDPKKLPTKLAEMLSSKPSFEEDGSVIPIRAAQ